MSDLWLFVSAGGDLRTYSPHHLIAVSKLELFYSVMELQSVVTELLSNFEFSMPKGAPKLQHGPAGLTVSPIVPGKAEEGPQIPLLVTVLNK